MTTRGDPGITTIARRRLAAASAARADLAVLRGLVRAPAADHDLTAPRARLASNGPRAREEDLVVARDFVPQAARALIAGPVPEVPDRAEHGPAVLVREVLDPPGHGPREGFAPIASVRPVPTVSSGRTVSSPVLSARRISSVPPAPRFRFATTTPSARCARCGPIARSVRLPPAPVSVLRCTCPRRSSRRWRGFALSCSDTRRPPR